jgi:hypothetical protein
VLLKAATVTTGPVGSDDPTVGDSLPGHDAPEFHLFCLPDLQNSKARERIAVGPPSVSSRRPQRVLEARLVLQLQKLLAFLATSEPGRARSFYRDTLGLTLVSEDPFALVFDAAGTMLRVAVVSQVVAAPYTVLGWQVGDVRAMARRLRKAGIPPERYPGMNQDADGIWISPSGA